jgi:hypothetical protein
MVLEVSEVWAGRQEPAVADFAAAFVVVGLVSAMTSLLMLRLPADAGDEIAGRALPPADPPRVPA